MVGRISGVVLAAALLGGMFALSQPGAAAPGECGPVTLDQLFPDLDVDGQPTTTTSIPETTTTTTAAGEETTTTATPGPTTTTPPEGESTTTVGGESPPTTIAPTPPTTKPCPTWLYEMEFPLASEARVVSGFGADRDGGSRRHKGTDILAPRLTPVLAVADGVVASVHSTPPDDCCWMMLTHHDGWKSLYVHLNNDSYLTDDGVGHGVVPGLEVGSEVKAGQVIGWVGDSGNAESTVPHLHFELRHPDGHSVDAFPSLKRAAAEVELPPYFGPYRDDDGMAVERYTSQLVASGAYWPCDETGMNVCPNRLAQPEDTAELIGLITGMTPPLIDTTEQTLAFVAIVPDNFAGQVTGCEIVRDCLSVGITEGGVARLIAWLHHVDHLAPDNPEVDAAEQVEVPTFGDAERTLRFLGVLGVCQQSPDDSQLITRSDVLELLNRWLLGDPTLSCVQSFGPER